MCTADIVGDEEAQIETLAIVFIATLLPPLCGVLSMCMFKCVFMCVFMHADVCVNGGECAQKHVSHSITVANN